MYLNHNHYNNNNNNNKYNNNYNYNTVVTAPFKNVKYKCTGNILGVAG
jgi:hypothetical protein